MDKVNRVLKYHFSVLELPPGQEWHGWDQLQVLLFGGCAALAVAHHASVPQCGRWHMSSQCGTLFLVDKAAHLQSDQGSATVP